MARPQDTAETETAPMSRLPPLPTKEQYDDLRAFLTPRQRSLWNRAPVADPDIESMIWTWDRFARRYSNLVFTALRAGDLQAAAQAWAVIGDLLCAWPAEELPPSLREFVAQAGRASDDPWKSEPGGPALWGK
ncbi:hypothetical protein OG689_29510 [Kitasatospora sp. NBC_00240]|uniref:hypothetical protein n=1 Tax=Kitasatospora sp. NBC_00240 TaxID=2903567 RepID=UPI002250A39F|nr:hypothetical protein [Kitasatospora sp. NBC_00240]MCX5213355.1 hypothetical protein [Kitasatospora sp. NBC_00240]